MSIINSPAWASFIPTLLAETAQRRASIDQVRQIGPLGDTPIVVLASSTLSAFYTDPVAPEMSGSRMAELARTMLDGSRLAIAQLSSIGRLEPVSQSGHYIQFDRPDAVILAIQGMIAAIRG